MAIQIRRTTTGTPTSLRPGQLAVELEAQPSPRLWVGTDTEPRLVSPAGQDVPLVLRVRILGGGQGRAVVGASVILELDRPAPTDCWVQFWRLKRPAQQGRGGGGPRNIGSGFMRIGFNDPHNTGGLAPVQIPPNATAVSAGTVRQLFRPPTVRNGNMEGYSRYRREVPGPEQDLDLPLWMRAMRRDIKCILKFGTVRRHRPPPDEFMVEDRSPMSAETLRIMRWRYSWKGAVQVEHEWGFKVDCL